MSECRCGKEDCPGPENCVCGTSCGCGIAPSRKIATVKPVDGVINVLPEHTTGIDLMSVARYLR